ncbi:MAG TPA: class I SAM-dependent methyltransferase [Methylomirabilota bacterium]|nr:class I SAM-dependent methyltransferase [Methylomirabilota bacterium]
MTVGTELRDRLRRYYTAYYRDTLAIPDWPALVELRLEEEQRLEAPHLARVRALLGDGVLRGRLLNVGCGTGGFNVLAAEAGARAVGVDESGDAIAICGLKARKAGGTFVRARAEALPFRDGTFDLVYCFSAIEHVASVDLTVAEMARVTRHGGAVYVHTPNAWSWWEGHYKIAWIPFLPGPVARLYLLLRHRPTAYLATLRRLTPGALRRAFARAGLTNLTPHGDTPGRESVGVRRRLISLYYRLTGMAPFIELVARKT